MRSKIMLFKPFFNLKTDLIFVLICLFRKPKFPVLSFLFFKVWPEYLMFLTRFERSTFHFPVNFACNREISGEQVAFRTEHSATNLPI